MEINSFYGLFYINIMPMFLTGAKILDNGDLQIAWFLFLYSIYLYFFSVFLLHLLHKLGSD